MNDLLDENGLYFGSKDPLGDRMKQIESEATKTRLSAQLPIACRIDGRSFSNFTRNLQKPFDPKMSQLMIETTKRLVEQSHADLGYVQSDEISLVFLPKGTEGLFGGKVFKLTSVLASIATAEFITLMPAYIGIQPKTPNFDCRVWSVPSPAEAANTILWRYFDCKKNSISSAAHCHFSPKQLHGKNTDEQLEMLKTYSVFWDAYPDFYKYGTFVRRETFQSSLTEEELRKIPEKHRPTNIQITRSRVIAWSQPVDPKDKEWFSRLLGVNNEEKGQKVC